MEDLNSSHENILPEQIALQNHLVLEGILKQLEVRDLLSCRLVSREWASIATGYLSVGGSIWIQLSPPFAHLKEIGRFLSSNKISHGLILSFCNPPWLENMLCFNSGVNEDDLRPISRPDDGGGGGYISCMIGVSQKKYSDARRKDKWIKEYDQQILEYISETGELVDELRLEMKYMEASDSAFLADFHTHLKNCGTVYLNIVDFNEEGWNSAGKWVPDSVTTLGISIAEGSPFPSTLENDALTLPHCIQFLKGCSAVNIQTFDFQGLDSFYPRHERSAWRLLVLEALATLCKEHPESFPKLRCISHAIKLADDTTQLKNFPRGLKRLHLYTMNEFRAGFLPILIKHGSTLELIDLEHFIHDGKESVEIQDQLVLPPMRHLKRLDITYGGRLDWEGWNVEKMDVLGLRRILTDENYPSKFPMLETLSIFFFRDLFYDKGFDIWHWIFPDGLKNNGVKVLNVSLAVADCSSPEIQRILNIFPSLKIFRHVLLQGLADDEDENRNYYYAACEHRIRKDSHSCRILSKWTSMYAKYVGYKFADQCFIVNRLRKQLGGEEHLFCKRSYYPDEYQDSDSDYICVFENDPFVHSAWGDQHKAEWKVKMLANPRAEFTKAIEMDLDLTAVLGSVRSKRYAIVIKAFGAR